MIATNEGFSLARKLRMPNFFSMTLRSEYGRIAARTFFADGSFEALAAVEAKIAACVDKNALDRLTGEEIHFRTPQGIVPVPVDIGANNQLLGACRELGPFRFGYEPEIHCAIDALTSPDAVIFDVGANWAPVSFQAALRSGFRGRIFTFEPQPQAFANTLEFVARLNLEGRVFPRNIGLSDRREDARLGEARWSGDVSVSADGQGRSCELMALDALSLPPPQMIKIDVEGYESRVIAGAAQILQQARPFVIFEDWLKNPKSHFEQLGEYGYSFYLLGWYSPFLDEVLDEPPFRAEIQVFALKNFDLPTRQRLPNRINVLASPTRLTAWP